MMPQDSLSLVLSTGLGFSVLAGLVSGVVYILSIRSNQRRRSSLDKPKTLWQCSYCGAQFRSISGVLEYEEVVTCLRCNRSYCREKCASRITADLQIKTGWICKKCRPASWITGMMNILQYRKRKGWFTKKLTLTQTNMNEELNDVQRKERERIRDFIERLVESLLGGDLDNISVTKIFKDERYDAIYTKYHADLSSALNDLSSAFRVTISNLPIAGESPRSAHSGLKKLIHRFIHEASELPDLQEFDSKQPENVDEAKHHRTYEDILSTAIINTVVQNYQAKPSSSTSKPSGHNYDRPSKSQREYFLGERNLEGREGHSDDASVSSLDEYINTSGTTKYFDQMNLAIQQNIKEVSSSEEERENEDFDNNVEVDGEGLPKHGWQKNWLLCKRDYAPGSNSPVPVPMLVPNPTNNAKVLIGDRDADDTTDLSDAGSDNEDSVEANSGNGKLVAKSNSLNVLNETEEENMPYHKGANTQIYNNTDDDVIIETLNSGLVQLDMDAGACADVEDHSLLSLESNTEKDLEYTEKYGTLPRKMPMSRQSKDNVEQDEINHYYRDDAITKMNYLLDDSKGDNGDSGVTSDEDDRKQFHGSSYGEREKDKWNHAINIPNNPYSKSNLERRLSDRSSTNSNSHLLTPPLPQTPQPSTKSLFDVFNEDRVAGKHRFGADYFAKSAGRPKGALRKEWIANNLQGTFEEREGSGDNSDVDSKVVALTPDCDAHDSKIDEPIIPQENLFRATPVFIDHDSTKSNTFEDKHQTNYTQGEMETSIGSTSPRRTYPWDISTDSDYSIERTYNVNTGKIIKRHGDIEYEVPKREKLFEFPNNVVRKALDENQNPLKGQSFTEDSDGPEDLSVSPVVPPAINHFKLVNDIANESSDQYHIVLISPPAEFQIKHLHTTSPIHPGDAAEKSFNEISLKESIEMRMSEIESFAKNVPQAEICEREIKGLKEQQLVSTLLTAFSQPTASNEESEQHETDHIKVENMENYSSDIVANDIEIEDVLIANPLQSVNALKKVYQNETDCKKEVYSLTARSLPKHVRQELAAQVVGPRAKQRSNSNEEVDLVDDTEAPDIIFPNAKNTIAYWEQMSKQQ